MQFKIKMSDNQYNTKSISMIADIEGDFSDMIDGELPTILPILPVRNIVVFPGVVWPILLGRDSSLKLAWRSCQDSQAIHITQWFYHGDSSNFRSFPTEEDYPVSALS